MNSTSQATTSPRPENPTLRSMEPLVRSSRSSKIQERHLDRMAIVYVRQSSLRQVTEHTESRARQYDLATHAVALGWSAERVVIIDEDQGRSAMTADRRTGFQRVLSEVALDHVGVVLGLEMSRLARSSKDWHHLLELCALFGVLLGDQDGIYNPTESNDRLLLGLKGTMSEFELFTMRNRLTRGMLHKAERGELVIRVPTGYFRMPSGEVVLEPDEQARDVTRMIFDKFDELGTVYSLVRHLNQNRIFLGMRLNSGPRQGELVWRRPSLSHLIHVLRHPIYAGAYAYGRESRGQRERNAAKATPPTPEHEWKVLLRDRMPAYITWERYLANRERLRSNRCTAKTPGITRNGSALLTGILVCGRCGRRMYSHYRHARHPFYMCMGDVEHAQERTCHGLNAASIDAVVRQQVLRALEPSALELSLRVIDDEKRERQRHVRNWKQRLERAQYEAARAERQYKTVDPENRLVARTLEQQWEESLRCCQQLQDDYDRFVASRPPQFTAVERTQITALSQSIPELWNAPEITNSDRKQIIRCVVDHVVVHVMPENNQAQAEIHWQGGFVSLVQLQRSVRSYRQMDNHEQFWKRVTELRMEGATAATIAATLNAENFVTAQRRSRFSEAQMMSLLKRYGLGSLREATELAANEWKLKDLAHELGVPLETMRGWAKLGWVTSRQTPTQHFWILWADESELKRLRRLADLVKPGRGRYPDELTTPAKKN